MSVTRSMEPTLTRCFYLLFIFYKKFLQILINIFEPFAPEQGITVKQNDNDLLNATDGALEIQYQTTQTNVFNAFFILKGFASTSLFINFNGEHYHVF